MTLVVGGAGELEQVRDRVRRQMVGHRRAPAVAALLLALGSVQGTGEALVVAAVLGVLLAAFQVEMRRAGICLSLSRGQGWPAGLLVGYRCIALAGAFGIVSGGFLFLVAGVALLLAAQAAHRHDRGVLDRIEEAFQAGPVPLDPATPVFNLESIVHGRKALPARERVTRPPAPVDPPRIGRCPACSTLEGPPQWVRCPVCETLQHADCWIYAGGCSRFGCAAAPLAGGGGEDPKELIGDAPPGSCPGSGVQGP